MFIGINPFSDCYFGYHDLISRGIPFHITNYTDFVAKYDTTEWKAAYDIIIFGGSYTADEMVTPTDVKAVVLDIINNNKYKIIQVAYLGMSKSGQPRAYWYSDLGIQVNADGSPDGTNFNIADKVVNNTRADVIVDASNYQVSGWCTNMYGTSLVCLSHGEVTTSHWFAAAQAGRKWALVGTQAGLNNVFNTAIDIGKLVWYLRDVKSHLCYN